MGHYDIVVVGAGIVGLSTGLGLLQRYPRLSLVVVDKESSVGVHQTGHNSGVVHRGVYYAPNSLKAQLCVAGSRELLRYCDDRGVPYQECGKLIVAISPDEVERLAELGRRATQNGVPEARMIGPSQIVEIEPAIPTGLAALYSPKTAILDFGLVAEAYARDLVAMGGEIRLGIHVRSIQSSARATRLESDQGDLDAKHVINCAGLGSDKLVPASISARIRIVPFRGDYFLLREDKASLFRGLVYPVPDPRFPFLGVHFTKRMNGEVWAGPNAVLALAREGYGKFDIDLRDVAGMLLWGGFWRMARRYWRTGLTEIRRDYSKAAFLKALQRFMPSLVAADLTPGPSGVRAQAVTDDGELLDDFALSASERAIHVLNAPSPAATSSLAIGRYIADQAAEAFSL